MYIICVYLCVVCDNWKLYPTFYQSLVTTLPIFTIFFLNLFNLMFILHYFIKHFNKIKHCKQIWTLPKYLIICNYSFIFLNDWFLSHMTTPSSWTSFLLEAFLNILLGCPYLSYQLRFKSVRRVQCVIHIYECRASKKYGATTFKLQSIVIKTHITILLGTRIIFPSFRLNIPKSA